MDPPDDAVQITPASLWVDGGIVHLRAKGAPRSAYDPSEVFDAARDLIRDTPMPALFDLRLWKEGERPAWQAFISNALSLFSAAAIVVDPESSPRMGDLPDIISRLLIPVEVFTDEDEALAYLHGYVQPAPQE